MQWASKAGAFIIEDDYDSEFRFAEQPVGALQGLDRNSNVIFVGTFNKVLFSSLRLGYIVLPPPLVDVFLSHRRQTDFHTLSLDQAVLCDFIAEGHFSRHLRRMRDLYASRLAFMIDAGREHLKGLLRISGVQAGLYTAAFLENGMTSREAEAAAAAHGVFIQSQSLPNFAGTPGSSNCQGQSVAALAKQFGGIDAAAAALGYTSVKSLQNAIKAFCRMANVERIEASIAAGSKPATSLR